MDRIELFHINISINLKTGCLPVRILEIYDRR